MSIGGSAAITTQPTPVFATTDTYDGIQRPVSMSATRSGTTIWSQTKNYDNVGNTLSLSTTLPTTAGGTQTDNQSFCYDALNRLVWAGDTGTPTGGDHCGSAPSGSTISTSQQSYSYDVLDRVTSGPAGTETYGTTPTHGANTLSSVPNQYASYDAMGDMTCRNVDTTASSTQSCDASQTGALMSYDNEGRLSSWTAPGASTPSDQFLYDNTGQRVLQRVSNGAGSPTDTISFDGTTDVTINGSQTSTTKYYAAGGQKIAMRKDGVVSYLLPATLGSVSLTLYTDGSTESVQLYAPYGATRYSDGSTPTVYGFTGQRSDSATGLMYYGARYYDPVSGRFTSADSVVNNATGNDPFAYVDDNPETNTDPSGHMIAGPDGGVNQTAIVTPSGVTHVSNIDGNSVPYTVIPPSPGHEGPAIRSYPNGYNSAGVYAPNEYDASPSWGIGNSHPGGNVQSKPQPQKDSSPIPPGLSAAGAPLYRNLRPDEDIKEGIFAKDPYADETVADHIEYGSEPGFASQYISVTRSRLVAFFWAQSGGRVIEIDPLKVDGNIIDTATEEALAKQGIKPGSTAYRYAIMSQEKLVDGSIPPEAVTGWWDIGVQNVENSIESNLPEIDGALLAADFEE